ncbi:MAG: hypothetical protein QM644_08520 [Mobilitalea sp.]
MKKIKKLLALILASMMVFSLAACSSNGNANSNVNGNTTDPEDDTPQATTAPTGSSDEKRIINIGTWWTQYYDSSNESVEDDPSYSGLDVAHLKFDNVAAIEQRYNVEFYWKNLTYAGVQESINNSILAGTPDCDIYLVELAFGIPAALNGLATDLKTVLPEDNDLFTTKKNITYLDLGDGKASILKRVDAQTKVEATYPLGFNIQMLADNNLEDPRELYARGEWTWDKFIEYCKVLTQDTDGDGQTDQYGYCGFNNETFEQLLMSNGAHVAATKTEELSSAATGEVLQMMSDIYNVYNVAYPYDFESGDDSTTMRGQYREGNIGFFPIAAWIAADKADYDYGGANGYTLSFDTAYVQWPVGPSGDQATNAGKVSAGEYYIIPAGVKDPEKVYNVLYDMWNWYDGDVTVRDDEETLFWWYAVTASTEDLQNKNFAVMADVGSRETFELWNQLGIQYDLMSLIKGEVTPAQFQETYKQQVQDALDTYFN